MRKNAEELVNESRNLGTREINKKRGKRKISSITIIFIVLILALIVCGVYFKFFYTDKMTDLKRVSSLEIKNTAITKKGGLSWITADVKNTGSNKEKVKLNLTFYDKDKKEITTFEGYIEKIDKNQTTTLKTGITKDLSNAVNVKYTVIQ